MNPRTQNFATVSEVEKWVSETDLLAGSTVSALYVSSGRDTKPLTFLTPGFLGKQTDESVPAPNFFIYVDSNGIEENIAESLSFKDRENETSIRANDLGAANLADKQGRLVSIEWESSRYARNDCVVWILSCTNDSFTRLALGEGWRPTWFIGVCDGCSFHNCEDGQFGCPCVNMLDNVQTSIPVQLGARYWVTDHIVGATLNGASLVGGEDPDDGDMVAPEDPVAKITARQVCFLSTLFRGEPRRVGFRGGARVFRIGS